jgi:SulP family sulfate permease
MIFGVAKAIAREHNAMRDHEVLILDLQDVPVLGVTAALALENMIQEAAEHDRPVFVVGAQGQALRRLEKLGVRRFVPDSQLVETGEQALKSALAMLDAPSSGYTSVTTPVN